MKSILQVTLLASVWVLTQAPVLAADQNSFQVVAKDKDGNPKPGITLSVLSGGNKFSAGVTDSNGEQTVPLSLGNVPSNEKMQIVVRRCRHADGTATVEILILPADARIPPMENCDDQIAGVIPWPEHGGAVVTVNLLDHPNVAMGAGPGGGPSAPTGPAGQGASPFTFEGSLLGGLATAGNLSTTSAIEGDATMYFGPVGVGGGFVRSGDATVQGATTGSSLPTGPTTANFHAAEIKGIVKLLAVGPFSIAVQGGAWPFTARSSTTATIVVTSPTGGTSTEVVTTTRSLGGVAPVFGGSIEVQLMKHIAAQVAVKRGYLRSGSSLDQGVTVVLFGVSFSPQFPRGLFNVGSGAR